MNLTNTTQTFTTLLTHLIFVINKCQGELHLARLIPSYLPVVAGKAGSSLSVSVAQKKKEVPVLNHPLKELLPVDEGK